jgi:predicted SAM-dependent methyltransferase
MKRKLEIGSGNSPQPGYEHLEINPDCPHIEYNCSCESIPVPDETFDEIAAFHVLEHVCWTKTDIVLREWFRILRRGGMLKIATPDLAHVINAYVDQTDELWKKELEIPGWTFPDDCHTDKTAWLNFKLFSTDIPFNLHKATFDFSLLSKRLYSVGFTNVENCNGKYSLHVIATK